MSLTLVIGNKNYSSWSFRPWIAMKVARIPFTEEIVPLYEPGSRERVLQFSPGGKVPILIAGGEAIWESIAILEYLAESFPDVGLWPADAPMRSHARTIAAEMHAGFQALRRACPMNMWRPVKKRELAADALANVARIGAMWTDCRKRYGAVGPFLFGAFSNADAMYAPVVARFHTYDIEVSAEARVYMTAMMALPAWKEWTAAALKEPWVLPEDEVDWPTVLKV
jgi:glutathione S-transferase